MEILGVLVAAIAAFAWGAAWYMMVADQWMAAAGLNADSINRSDPKPYVISFISLVLVAGMMRHALGMAGIDTAAKGIVAGLGIGVFLVVPFILTNYMYAQRPTRLALIDGVYATVSCGIIGIVLTLF